MVRVAARVPAVKRQVVVGPARSAAATESNKQARTFTNSPEFLPSCHEQVLSHERQLVQGKSSLFVSIIRAIWHQAC